MAQILQIRRSAIAFDPEAIKIIAVAFDSAWDNIRRSGSALAKPAYANAMREVVAKNIIDAFGRGEIDQSRLAEGAKRFVAENYRD
jgi:hypothetical protein